MNRPDDHRGGPPDRLGRRQEDVRVPIVEEEVRVGKRSTETGRVRVSTHVEEEQLNLQETVGQEIVEVERVPVGIEVEQAPAPFERDGILIVPVIEERLVVEKKLFVVEEIRLHRRQTQKAVEIPVTRKVMHAEVERQGAQPSPAPAGGSRPAMFGKEPPAPAAPLGAHARSAPPPRAEAPPAGLVYPPQAGAQGRQQAPVGARSTPRLLPWLLGLAGILALLWLLSSLSGGDEGSSPPEESRVGASIPAAQQGRPAFLSTLV